MDAIRFDRLTRRFVLAGLAGGSLATLLGLDEAASTKKKPSKRKRCKDKKRNFCAGRCCPKRQQCLNKTCAVSCESPFQCPPGDPVDPFSCGPEDSCFCAKTPGGKSACVDIVPTTICGNLPACDSGTPCPAGQVCFTCSCVSGVTPNFRCGQLC